MTWIHDWSRFRGMTKIRTWQLLGLLTMIRQRSLKFGAWINIVIIRVAPGLYGVRRLWDEKAEDRGREGEDTRSVATETQGWEVNAITVEL